MKKTLYFDEYCGYTVSAITENGKLTEFNFEKEDSRSVKGNIYKGKIVNVLPGMQAAFVDCGFDRNCYLSAEDAVTGADKYDGEGSEVTMPELKEGDDVLVQVVKPATGKKGAKVTLFLSFVGKNVIYLPNTPFVGVSRKISDDELRKNLAYSVKNLLDDGEGIILRTAAPYTRRDLIETEFMSLKNVCNSVKEQFAGAPAGTLLYSESALVSRVLRDILSYDIEEIFVGSPRLKKVVESFYTRFPPSRRRPVTVHNSDRDMFEEYGISAQIKEMTTPRAELGNGAYLVIDKCEALTAIDVNTGGFTGSENLEQTVYCTNVLAAQEIARQIKLRNIGGIIVIDFIDMTDEAHNKTVVEELERALKNYGLKCCVGEMSQFGLVELTRKREGTNVAPLLRKPCSACGEGFVLSPQYVLLETRAKLLALYSGGAKRITLDMSADTLSALLEWDALLGDLRLKMPCAEVYARPHRSFKDVRIHCNQPDISDRTVRLI